MEGKQAFSMSKASLISEISNDLLQQKEELKQW